MKSRPSRTAGRIRALTWPLAGVLLWLVAPPHSRQAGMPEEPVRALLDLKMVDTP